MHCGVEETGVKRMSRREQRARVGVSGRERTGWLSQRWIIKTADREGKKSQKQKFRAERYLQMRKQRFAYGHRTFCGEAIVNI